MLARELKLLTLAVVSGSLIACGGESQEAPEQETKEVKLSAECVSTKTLALSEDVSYGDGSDGEFLLAADESHELDRVTYNFTRVILNSGSHLTLSGDLLASTEQIIINSQGGCELLGDIDLTGFEGGLTLKCGTRITMTGSYNHPDGSTQLLTPEDSLESSENSNNISEATISSSSIDLSAAEFTTASVSFIGGDLTVNDGITISNEDPTTVTSLNSGNLSLESDLENTTAETPPIVINDTGLEIDSEPEDTSHISADSSESQISCTS
ncbi:hypothetical protein [Agaribacterium sp. ZY112]|uniref:hypothetical protein n=1 Tax=Agaribacterium sp. ZY112 TaxID=3233574 RepID=UPI0035235AF3